MVSFPDILAVNIDQSAIPSHIKAINAQVSTLTGKERIDLIHKIIGLIDLTTLSGDDTPDIVRKLVDKALSPLPSKRDISCAAVCVYPARIVDVVEHMNNCDRKINVASVAGGFPSGQYRLETRLLEIKLAIEDGAMEIDTVINRCAALTNNWQTVFNELVQMKSLCSQKAILKTILATGELKNLENVYKASLIAMHAGSDFIKTSTGKENVNATLPVAYVMCMAIKKFHEKTGKRVGFKPAGGIKTVDDALSYYLMVKSILGDDWLNADLFRIGASSLLDVLIRES
uniref:deoxyribose-phosphate aldolase n=1 Tax=Romanomermis culicivorax TaxID=13658 RepID=A0A915KK14_ROMCU